jgi:hypothetical protein
MISKLEEIPSAFDGGIASTSSGTAKATRKRNKEIAVKEFKLAGDNSLFPAKANSKYLGGARHGSASPRQDL